MAAYTTDWKIVTPLIGAQPIAETSTTQRHALGTIVEAKDAGHANNLAGNGVGSFVYAIGVGSTVAGSWVTFLEDGWTTALIAGNAIGKVGVAMSANAATTAYGWYQIRGKAVAVAATGFADNANVYTSSAGVVDDSIVAGDRVQNCKGASALDAPATGFAEFEIDNPFVNDALAD